MRLFKLQRRSETSLWTGGEAFRQEQLAKRRDGKSFCLVLVTVSKKSFHFLFITLQSNHDQNHIKKHEPGVMTLLKRREVAIDCLTNAMDLQLNRYSSTHQEHDH